MSIFFLRFILSAILAEMMSRCLWCPVHRFQERRSMCKDSMFMLTLARKSKCFLSYEQIIVDSNKIFGGKNCLLIIIFVFNSKLSSESKVVLTSTIDQLDYANTHQKLASLSAIALSDSCAFLMLSNLPHAAWLNGACWAVYHLLMM